MNEKLIQKIRNYLIDKPIDKAYLFGSYARNEQRRGSDVDILVECQKDNDLSIFDWVQMEFELKNILRKKVDLSDRAALDKLIMPFIEKDKILIYER
jgi:predicted nucleotidyltransferase